MRALLPPLMLLLLAVLAAAVFVQFRGSSTSGLSIPETGSILLGTPSGQDHGPVEASYRSRAGHEMMHRVVAGESLRSILVDYYGSVGADFLARVAEYNELTISSTLEPGLWLRLPAIDGRTPRRPRGR